MIFNNFDYNKISNTEEQKLFFSLLYHDSRKGQIIRIEKPVEGKKVSQFTTCDIGQLGYTGTDCNVYVSVNTFRGHKRTSDQMFNRTAFFLDLDFHKGFSEMERESALKNTKDILEKAYAEKELAVPTCVIHSGRGFAIYYILKHSIANSAASQSSLSHFKKVYDKLCHRYQEVLNNTSQDLVCEVDMKVMDDSRIARMPGTVNQSAHKTAHLISVNKINDNEPLYYNIKDIISDCKIDMSEEKAQRNYHVDIRHIGMQLNPFLATRVHRLEIIRDLRGEACVDECREILCFIAYSALTQIYPRQQALDELHSFNDGFTETLPEAELTHIIEETDNHTVPAGKFCGAKGFYPFNDSTIVKKLDLTDEEIQAACFGQSWRRQKEKEENQKKRQSRDEKIIELIQNHPGMTYAQIAEEIGVSERTVCRVAKKNGICRHQWEPVSEADQKVEEKNAEILIFDQPEKKRQTEYVKNDLESKDMGSDKNLYESWCVCYKNIFSLLSSSSLLIGWRDQVQKLVHMILDFEDYDLLDYVCRELYGRMRKTKQCLENAVGRVFNDLVVYTFDYFDAHDPARFTDLICSRIGGVSEDDCGVMPG